MSARYYVADVEMKKPLKYGAYLSFNYSCFSEMDSGGVRDRVVGILRQQVAVLQRIVCRGSRWIALRIQMSFRDLRIEGTRLHGCQIKTVAN